VFDIGTGQIGSVSLQEPRIRVLEMTTGAMIRAGVPALPGASTAASVPMLSADARRDGATRTDGTVGRIVTGAGPVVTTVSSDTRTATGTTTLGTLTTATDTTIKSTTTDATGVLASSSDVLTGATKDTVLALQTLNSRIISAGDNTGGGTGSGSGSGSGSGTGTGTGTGTGSGTGGSEPDPGDGVLPELVQEISDIAGGILGKTGGLLSP
jgi:hypothetical protein